MITIKLIVIKMMIKKFQLDKPFYRMKAIADMLNVHSRTVQRWCIKCMA